MPESIHFDPFKEYLTDKLAYELAYFEERAFVLESDFLEAAEEIQRIWGP